MLLSLLATALLPQRRVVLFVDPCGDTQATAAVEARGAEVLPLNSPATAEAMAGRDWCDADVPQAPDEGEEERWAAERLAGVRLEGVLCGSDAGLACAERLQHALLPERSNGLVAARRDKFLCNEALRAAGLPTAAQAAPKTWEAAEAFLRTLMPSGGGGADGEAAAEKQGELRAVLKPRRGTASVGVLVARSLEEAKETWGVLSRAHVSVDESELQREGRVVVQELLDGDEWIVDTVSCGGEHKVVALWRYDKGEANGAPFVYFGAELMGSAEAEATALAAYARDALDALGWRWGPAHIEVRMTSGGPRLIEVNAGRCNGLDFKLLADLGYGYNAHEATAAAFLSPADAFAALPPLPPATPVCHAWLVTLVSHARGALVRLCHRDEVEALTSLLSFEPEAAAPGDAVRHTTDLDTCAGTALLVNADRAVLGAEYRRLRALQRTMFEVE